MTDLAIEELMDVEQAAAYLERSVSTLTTWRWDKKGPAYYKIGRNVRYARADLDAFKATQYRRIEPQAS